MFYFELIPSVKRFVTFLYNVEATLIGTLSSSLNTLRSSCGMVNDVWGSIAPLMSDVSMIAI